MEKSINQISTILPDTYARIGIDSIRSRGNIIKSFLSERKIPINGWDESTIDYFLMELSLMDSNNHKSNLGLGEREGRVFSSLVYRRHFGLSHGIGRSGDILEIQPKAVGSSLIYQLTNFMALVSIISFTP